MCLRFCVTEFASFGQNSFLLTVAVPESKSFIFQHQFSVDQLLMLLFVRIYIQYTHMLRVPAYTQQQIMGIPKKTRLPHLQRHRQTFNKPKLAVFVPFVHKYDCTIRTILKISLGMAAISMGGKMTNIAASRGKTTTDNRHLTLCEVKKARHRVWSKRSARSSRVVSVTIHCNPSLHTESSQRSDHSLKPTCVPKYQHQTTTPNCFLMSRFLLAK